MHAEGPNRTICCVLAKNGLACFNILSALSLQKKFEWNDLIMPHCPVELISDVAKAAERSGVLADWQTRFHFLTLDSLQQLSSTPSRGSSTTTFHIRRLQLEEAEDVDASWRFRSAHSLQFIRSLIGAPNTTAPHPLLLRAATPSSTFHRCPTYSARLGVSPPRSFSKRAASRRHAQCHRSGERIARGRRTRGGGSVRFAGTAELRRGSVEGGGCPT